MANQYAILLVRVSTSGQNFDPQISDLTTYAKSKGYNKLHVISAQESGYNNADKRAGLNELFDFIKDNPKYSTVFVTEISRLARKQAVLYSVRDWFIDNKVQLLIKHFDLKLLDDNGKSNGNTNLAFSMFAAFAENEMIIKKERFIRAKKKLWAEGKGMSNAMFGYKKNYSETYSTLEIDYENAEIVKQIFNWYLYGIDNDLSLASTVKIARHCLKLGYPKFTHSKRNINKTLKERGYTGFKISNNKYKNPKFGEANEEKYLVSSNEIKYPQIITNEMFELVQKRLSENNVKGDKTIKDTLLARLIKCPICGKSLSANYRLKDGYNKSSYRCTGRGYTVPCGSKISLAMPLYDSAMWALIKSDIDLFAKTIEKINPNLNLDEYNNQIQRFNTKISELLAEESNIKNTVRTLVKFLTPSEIKTYEKQLAKSYIERDRYQSEINKIQFEISRKQAELKDTKELVKQNLSEIENEKTLMLRYLNSFVESIEVKLHTTRFTILKVHFKQFSRGKNRKLGKDVVVNIDKALSEVTYLVIDKKLTIYPKVVKVTVGFLEGDENLTEDNAKNMIDKAYNPTHQFDIHLFQSLNFERLKFTS